MFSRDFRIWGSILIGWTVVLLIYPFIGMTLLNMGIGTFIFCRAVWGVRDGEISIGRFSASITIYKERQPLFFRIIIMITALFGISLIVGILIIAIIKHKDLLIHYPMSEIL